MIIKCIAKNKIDPAVHVIISGPHKTPVDCSDNPKINSIKEEFKKNLNDPLDHQIYLEQQDPNGPGTKLSQMLEKIGIKSAPNCSCKARAKIMNEKGYEWCEQNLDTIVGWLKEEAQKRKLPFIDIAGKILVRRAISLSKQAKKNEKK